MAFGDNQSDFDYIISDARGRIRVIDGEEYPITEEEYRRENPYHKDSGCTECNFVQDKEILFLYLVPRDLKEKVTNKPLFVGKFTMTGWTGHSGFYLFRCRFCNEVSIDYPGYIGSSLPYLRCDYCREKLNLEVTEEKNIYEREDFPIPKLTRKERMSELNDVIVEAEARGVKIIVASSENGYRPKGGFFKFLRRCFKF